MAVPSARAVPAECLIFELAVLDPLVPCRWSMPIPIAAADTSQRCDASAQSYESVHNYFSFYCKVVWLFNLSVSHSLETYVFVFLTSLFMKESIGGEE